MPIIDPWLIYSLQLVDGLRELNAVISLISILFALLAAIACFLMDASEGFDEESGALKFFKSNLLKPLAFVIILTSLITLFVPTKTTLIAMLVAKNVTYERVDMAGEKLEVLIDKILEKTQKMIKDNEKEE